MTRLHRIATLFCCGFFGITVILELCRRVYIPSLWNTLYTRVYNGVVWLPESPQEVKERFSVTNNVVEISLFGISNVDEVRSGVHKPIMERIGTYVFEKKRTRTNVEWSDEDESVGFVQGDEYSFVESASRGNLNDSVTTLNIPLVGVVEMILDRYPSGRVSDMLQLVAHTVEVWGDDRVSGIFTTRQVGELLFGYTDPLLSVLAHMIPGIESTFSLLGGKEQQSFKIQTGKNRLEELGELISWQGVQEIKAWAEPEPVRGTDGRQFSPSIRESSVVDVYNRTRRVWVAEAFRSFDMVPSPGYDSGDLEGVDVIHLVPSEQAFKASEKYYQEYSGLLNITHPLHAGVDGNVPGAGPRLFLSLPGYCEVDPAVSMTIEGMSCVDTVVDKNPPIFLDIEPTTGITVNARKSLLLSSWIGELYSYIEPKIHTQAFIPVMEVVDSSIADSQSLAKLKTLQAGVEILKYLQQHLPFWSTLCIICGSSIALSLGLMEVGYHHSRQQRKHSSLDQALLS